VQRLHLVGFTSELDGLIFSASTGARSGGYVVALDAELLNVIRDVLARRDGPRQLPDAGPRSAAPRAGEPPARLGRDGSALAPREIQSRLRAGRSIGEVALEAGVDDEWVRRFAPPVYAEQTHVVSRALAVHIHAEDAAPSQESLFDSVAANLLARGVGLTEDELANGWSAFQMRDSAWVVQFRTTVGAKELLARWGFDIRAGTLVALNRPAAELGWIDGDASRRSAFAAIDDLADDPDAPPIGVSRGDAAPEETPAPARTPRRRTSTAAKRSASSPPAAGGPAVPDPADDGSPVDGSPADGSPADGSPADGQSTLPLTEAVPSAPAAVRGTRRRAAPGA
jgi:hypothetical protein